MSADASESSSEQRELKSDYRLKPLWYDMFLELQTQAVLEALEQRRHTLPGAIGHAFSHCVSETSGLNQPERTSPEDHARFLESSKARIQELAGANDILELRREYPVERFESNIRSFLQMVHDQMEDPILVKVRVASAFDLSCQK
ncbi:hypothetical protein HK102_013074 [Quaeritorhiza haematococci]|nr:hypothetical protein HK102_013074 [Quaeritorhiza haematococci]